MIIIKLKTEISISVKDIKAWINVSTSLHGLQSIRATINKRLKYLFQKQEYNPMDRLPLWIKKIIIQPLIIEQKKLEYKPTHFTKNKEARIS